MSATGTYTKAQQSFYDAMWPLAVDASLKTHIFPEIIFAQSADETGYGLHAPGNNYFGIKNTVADGLNTIQTTAEYISGKWRTERDSFFGYRNMAASVAGYVNFITRYKRYLAFRAGRTIADQLEALQASGYATDPKYGSKLAAIIAEIPLSPSIQTAAKQPPIPAVIVAPQAQLKGSPMSVNILKLLEGAGNVIKELAIIAPIPAAASTAVGAVIDGIETAVNQGKQAAVTIAANPPTGAAVVQTFEGSALQVATDAFVELLPEALNDLATGNVSFAILGAQAEQAFEDGVTKTMQATKPPTAN